MSCFTMAQTSTETIGKPVGIGKLEVAQFDFPEQMRCDDAKVECAKLGNGWRLPTKDELNILYQNQVKIGEQEFHAYGYWSSTEGVNENQIDPMWSLDFRNGNWIAYGKAVKLYVRAVRSL